MNNSKRKTTFHVQVDVVRVHDNGWAAGTIIRDHTGSHHKESQESQPCCGDRVAIPKSALVKTGDRVFCKVVSNSNRKTSRHQPWFACFCERNLHGKVPKPKWSPWQSGKNAFILKLPSTQAGSYHHGIVCACWQCGQQIVQGNQIFCIKNTCIWTLPILLDDHLYVDPNRDYNDIKKCSVQKVRCKCKSIVGSYYEKAYDGCDETQQFPCYKLVTVWERREWETEDKPSFAMVLTGNKEYTEACITNLQPSDEWEIEKHFQVGGRIDKDTYLRIEKAKAKMMKAAELKIAESSAAESEKFKQRALEAESLAAAKAAEAAEALNQAKEEASRAATKAAEAEASKRRAEDAEQQLMRAKLSAISNKPAIHIWECNVEGAWLPYAAFVSRTLDTGFTQKLNVTFELHGKKYEVIYNEMIQRNIATGYRREVRRRWRGVAQAIRSPSAGVFWECMLVETDGWTSYPQPITDQLEHHYQQGSKTMVTFNLSGQKYAIDFKLNTLEQVNCKTGFRRQVRRRQTGNTPTSGNILSINSVPNTWTENGPGQNCELVPVLKGSSEWHTIEKKLTKTLSSVTLHKVVRVQNIALWEYYCFQKGRIMRASGRDPPNVIQVWHGTRTNTPMDICTDEQDGFMMQHSRTGMWGQGIYFAADARYSNKYAHEATDSETGLVGSLLSRMLFNPQNTRKTRTLILASLVAGDEIDLPPDKSLRLCPKKPTGNGRYNTVTGQTEGSKVYIIYENGRAYPEYLVTYTR